MKKGCITIFALIGLVVVVGVVFVVGVFTFVASLTRPVVEVGDSFFTALQQANYQAAFDLTAPQYQASLGSAARISALAREYDLKPARWSYTNQSIRNAEGELIGTVEMENGQTLPIQIRLFNDGEWKITRVIIGTVPFP